MKEILLIELFSLAGVVIVAIPAYLKYLKPMRSENAADHARVRTTLDKLSEGQARIETRQEGIMTWQEQHDVRHEDLQDRLNDVLR